jgi:hypothetical protein
MDGAHVVPVPREGLARHADGEVGVAGAVEVARRERRAEVIVGLRGTRHTLRGLVPVLVSHRRRAVGEPQRMFIAPAAVLVPTLSSGTPTARSA